MSAMWLIVMCIRTENVYTIHTLTCTTTQLQWHNHALIQLTVYNFMTAGVYVYDTRVCVHIGTIHNPHTHAHHTYKRL
jgi:hypothetical protein